MIEEGQIGGEFLYQKEEKIILAYNQNTKGKFWKSYVSHKVWHTLQLSQNAQDLSNFLFLSE